MAYLFHLLLIRSIRHAGLLLVWIHFAAFQESDSLGWGGTEGLFLKTLPLSVSGLAAGDSITARRPIKLINTPCQPSCYGGCRHWPVPCKQLDLTGIRGPRGAATRCTWQSTVGSGIDAVEGAYCYYSKSHKFHITHYILLFRLGDIF